MTRGPFSPVDFKALDRDPELSAAEIYDYAPQTTAMLIALYCADMDEAETYAGRHVVTAELTGDEL